MKTSLILLITTAFFAVLTMALGYDVLFMNYQYWNCWDSCLWYNAEECDEICKEKDQLHEPISETREERRERLDKIREVYDPILREYDDKVMNSGWVLPRGYGFSYPDSPEENIEASYDYSDGIFIHLQKLEIVSPLSPTTDAGTISVIKELVFPELWVFLVSIVGICVFVGYRIRKK